MPFLFIVLGFILFLLYISVNKKKTLTKSTSLYDKLLNKFIDILQAIIGEKKLIAYERKVIDDFFLAKIKVKKPFKLYLSLKLVIPIVMVVIAVSMAYTNLDIEKDSILKDYNFSSNQINRKSLMGLSEAEYKQLQETEKNVTLDMFTVMDDLEYVTLGDNEKVQYIVGALERKYNLSDEENYFLASRVINKRIAIDNLKINIGFVLLISFLSIWLLDIVLKVIGGWGKADIDSEVEQLELTTVLIGATPHISVYDILVGLENTSKHFKPYLSAAKEEYTINNDNAILMLDNAPYQDFQIIRKTLMQAKNSSLEKSIENLRKHLERKKRKKEIEEESRLDKKDMMVHLLIVISMGCLLMMWFYPLTSIFANLN